MQSDRDKATADRSRQGVRQWSEDVEDERGREGWEEEERGKRDRVREREKGEREGKERGGRDNYSTNAILTI